MSSRGAGRSTVVVGVVGAMGEVVPGRWLAVDAAVEACEARRRRCGRFCFLVSPSFSPLLATPLLLFSFLRSVFLLLLDRLRERSLTGDEEKYQRSLYSIGCSGLWMRNEEARGLKNGCIMR